MSVILFRHTHTRAGSRIVSIPDAEQRAAVSSLQRDAYFFHSEKYNSRDDRIIITDLFIFIIRFTHPKSLVCTTKATTTANNFDDGIQKKRFIFLMVLLSPWLLSQSNNGSSVHSVNSSAWDDVLGVCYIVAIGSIRSSFNRKYTLFTLQLYTQSKRWIEIEPLVADMPLSHSFSWFLIRSCGDSSCCSPRSIRCRSFSVWPRIHFRWIDDIERNAAYTTHRRHHYRPLSPPVAGSACWFRFA